MNFPRLAGAAALLVAAANLAYAISFLVVRPDNPDAGGTAASAFLLAGGLLALPVVLALYGIARESDPQLAQLAALLGVVSALGAAIHGSYDVANAINPPHAALDLPNAIDPRGFLTFGLGGLSLLAFTPLVGRGLAPLAGALGAVLVALFALRLTVLDGAAIKALAALAGFVASPLWYVLVARRLWRRAAPRARSLSLAA
jgi:hypothetical protein